MSREALKVREQIFWPFSCPFQVEGIRAEIQLPGPGEGSMFRQESPPEELIIAPCCEHPLSHQVAEINCSLHTVPEAKPEPIITKHFEGDDSFHNAMIT